MLDKGQNRFGITAIVYIYPACKTLFAPVKPTKSSVQMSDKDQSSFRKSVLLILSTVRTWTLNDRRMDLTWFLAVAAKKTVYHSQHTLQLHTRQCNHFTIWHNGYIHVMSSDWNYFPRTIFSF